MKSPVAETAFRVSRSAVRVPRPASPHSASWNKLRATLFLPDVDGQVRRGEHVVVRRTGDADDDDVAAADRVSVQLGAEGDLSVFFAGGKLDRGSFHVGGQVAHFQHERAV